jgi:hypothetical protein
MKTPNVFSVLSRYGSGEEENYLTEAFAFLLRLLLEYQPNIGLALVNKLCGFPEENCFTNSQSVAISTQIIIDEGRPDIEIRDGRDTLVYVEIKHDAHLGTGQLEYYKRKLIEANFPNKELVLLTRSRILAQETTLKFDEYHHVCWYEIHYWLSKFNVQDEVCKYFIESFMLFLEGKRMSVKQVTWEYIQGVPALIALTTMMEVALVEAMPNVKLGRTAGWTWRGFNLNGGSYWCGIRYNQPLLVVFENNGGNNPTYKCDLDLNGFHFFSLTQTEQLECLINFFKDSNSNSPVKL